MNTISEGKTFTSDTRNEEKKIKKNEGWFNGRLGSIQFYLQFSSSERTLFRGFLYLSHS